jgi:hypothetical protein
MAQSEPGSLACRLGREEPVERVHLYRRVHTVTVVAHSDHHELRRNRLFASLRRDNVYPKLKWIELRRTNDAERYIKAVEALAP